MRFPATAAFYPEDEHIGIVGGRDSQGNPLVIHCTSGANNVVITTASDFPVLALSAVFQRSPACIGILWSVPSGTASSFFSYGIYIKKPVQTHQILL